MGSDMRSVQKRRLAERRAQSRIKKSGYPLDVFDIVLRQGFGELIANKTGMHF